MNALKRWNYSLETRWVAPAYAGWLLIGLSLFFLAAAVNTMAGWLYVISGVIFALLAIAAVLPERSLRHIHISRSPIQPVSAGEPLVVEVMVENLGKTPKTLLAVQDALPFVLGDPVSTAIDAIAPQAVHRWQYDYPTQRRGVYRWHTVNLRTGTPFGLFWCQRSQTVHALAIVYPVVLNLSHCPLIDQMGRDRHDQVQSYQQAHTSMEGLTRALRPYRWGDPIRLVHWRSSARYSELRVRELEVLTGGQEMVIALDSAIAWDADAFEQAVTTAASLYFYAMRRKLHTSVWTAQTGLVRGNYPVLEALAATQAAEEPIALEGHLRLPDAPWIWLTCDPQRLLRLPPGSGWVLWSPPQALDSPELLPCPSVQTPGIVIEPGRSLESQLQSPIQSSQPIPAP